MASNNDHISDILIIGGGVIGLSLARELSKRSAGKITLIERGKLGAEASFAAAGMLTAQAEADEWDPFFDLCYESRKLYRNFAEELLAETGQDIKLEASGTLSVSFSAKDSAKFETIYSWQKAAGLPVEKLTSEEILKLEPFLSTEILGGLFFPDDVQVDNRLLVSALSASIKQAGVEIYENTAVQEILVENGKITGALTEGGKFSAPVVVLATGAWSSLIKAGERSLVDVFPVRGQMLSFHPAEKMFSHVVMTANGYIVPRTDNRILVGATVENAGFNKELTKEGIEFLLKTAIEIAPVLKDNEIDEKWAGLRPCSADKMPVLGECGIESNLFVATAHYRNGILLAPLTAKLIGDVMCEGAPNKDLGNFSPNRFVSHLSVGM